MSISINLNTNEQSSISPLSSPSTSSEESLSPTITAVAKRTLLKAGASLQSVAIKAYDNLNSLLQPANFTSSIRSTSAGSIFANTPYDQKEFNQALEAYRSDVTDERTSGRGISEASQEIAVNFLTQPGLPHAHLVLLPILSRNTKSNAEALGIRSLLETDRKTIKQHSNVSEQGAIHKNVGKLSGEFGLWFDPVKNGNLPFLLGKKGAASILRHAVPTTEVPSMDSHVEINAEYRAFLDHCHKNNKRAFYFCLLNPKNTIDKKRIDALLQLDPEYENTFHMMRMPMDGPLNKVETFTSVTEYMRAIHEDIRLSISHPYKKDIQFLFSSSALAKEVEKIYADTLGLSHEMIQVVYDHRIQLARGDFFQKKIDSSTFMDTLIETLSPKSCEGAHTSAMETESKKAFMMLFCTILRSRLIQNMDINYYNNSCKDAIDRGAAHLITDLLWNSFLHNSLDEDSLSIRLSAAWPAYMAKTQPIMTERAEWIDAFASFIEKAAEDNLQERLKEMYIQAVGDIDPKIEFFNPQIEIHQSKEVIAKTIDLLKSKEDIIQHSSELSDEMLSTLQTVEHNEQDPLKLLDIICDTKEHLSRQVYGLQLSISGENYQVSVEKGSDLHMITIEDLLFHAKDSVEGEAIADIRCAVSLSIPTEIQSLGNTMSVSISSKIDVHAFTDKDYQVINNDA